MYCPSGTAVTLSVSTGYYSGPESVSDQYRSTQAPCDPGHYCIGGVRYSCDGGLYSTATLLNTPCTLPCPSGASLVPLSPHVSPPLLSP